ncbi:MAG: hypothetical protein GF334_13005 [Candidatus Altiarchaeales archaeon]|nr:hypothetical protein [Candidatus Altiarchaeales archaeon]
MALDKVQWAHTNNKTIEAIKFGDLDPACTAKITQASETKKIVFMAIPSFSYKEWILKTTQLLTEKNHRIGYVTFVWSPELLTKDFEEFNRKNPDKIRQEKIFFIDGTRKKNPPQKGLLSRLGLGGEKDSLNRIYLESFKNAQTLSNEVITSLKDDVVDIALIDTLAMLSYYWGDNMQVLRFAHNLIHSLLDKKIRAVFPFPIETSSIELARDLQMFAESVIIIK